jgi:NAD-dependent deacetylase sirtuin 5
VDDLHVRAGTRGLIRLHGSIWDLRCGSGGSLTAGRAAGRAGRGPCGGAAWRDERVPLPELPPRCPSCGGLARPAVVWFGEPLAAEDVAAAIQACQCDVFLTVGTSAVVYPAAGLVHEARRRGAYTAEINREPTPASQAVDLCILGAAEEILPRLHRLAYS